MPLIIIMGILTIILLGLLYRYLPNKKIFWCFCTLLAITGALAYTSFTHDNARPVLSQAERYELARQQKIFADWYDEYKLYIEQLDYNWQRYHQILASFKDDSISIYTAHSRLSQLEGAERELRDKLAKLVPPLELNDNCYDLTIVMLRKTNEYAAAQYAAIAHTKEAADPLNMPPDDQAMQSRILQEIMLRESPPGLFTAPEIYSIRKILTLPQDEPDVPENPQG